MMPSMTLRVRVWVPVLSIILGGVFGYFIFVVYFLTVLEGLQP